MEIFWACLLGAVIGVGIIGVWDAIFDLVHFGSGLLVAAGICAAGGGLIAAGVI